MKRLPVALTVINLALLVLILTQVRSTAAPAVSPMLRTRALELVDDRGQVRARLLAEVDGEVVLKLSDKNGTIRVKLGAAEHGSGLVLADETAQPGVHIIARRAGIAGRPTTTSITLKDADGQRVIRP